MLFYWKEYLFHFMLFDNLYYKSDTFRITPFPRKISINRFIIKCNVCFTLLS